MYGVLCACMDRSVSNNTPGYKNKRIPMGKTVVET